MSPAGIELRKELAREELRRVSMGKSPCLNSKRLSIGKEPFNLLLSAKSHQDLPADETESPSKELPKKEETYIKVTARLRPLLSVELNSKEVVAALPGDANSIKI